MSENHVKQFETKMLCMENVREKLTEQLDTATEESQLPHACVFVPC